MIECCPTNAGWWQPAHIIVLLLCLGIFMCHVAMIFSIKGFHFNFILVPIYGKTGIFKLTLTIPRFSSLLVTFTALWCLPSVEEKQRTMQKGLILNVHVQYSSEISNQCTCKHMHIFCINTKLLTTLKTHGWCKTKKSTQYIEPGKARGA